MTKVLLVEDDKSLREIYGVRLLAEGYDIVSAGDGEEALAMAIKERPQLIVSDVMMPKISGFDMLDILRSTTETKDIKVIMMTALSTEDQRARGEALGADRYLVKSQVGIEDVVRTVHEVLGDSLNNATGQQQNAFTPPAPTAVRPQQQDIPQQPQEAQPSELQEQVPQRPSAPSPPPRSPAPTVPSRPSTPPAPIQNNEQQVPQQQPPQEVQQLQQPPASAPNEAQGQQPGPGANPAQSEAPEGLPRPTAPFSTPRPANLGERVIQPLDGDERESQEDIAARIEMELGGQSQGQVQPPSPEVPPAPATPTTPQPQEWQQQTPEQQQ